MTIQRKIKCNYLDCPHEKQLKFSDWIREKMPDSHTGFFVTDIDFVFYNTKTNKIIIIEKKTRKSQVPEWQRKFFKNINNWLGAGIGEYWSFQGVHLLQFENYCFDDGKAYFDNKEITEDYFIKMFL